MKGYSDMERNETLKLLLQSKSVRVFEDREITRKEKDAVLLAAMAAPTAGNQQLYTILDITDPAIKARLAETCDHQPFIAQAKMVLIFCTDVRRWLDIFEEAGAKPRRPGPGDLLLACSDACIAAQNAVVAAQSMGIGACYIGDIMENRQEQCELLGLPEYVFPAAMVVFGYPTRQQQERAKPRRCRIDEIVMENGYRRRDGTMLRTMTEKDWSHTDFETWAARFCERKYNCDFSREMSRSVGEYLNEYQCEKT